jgi:hypothetical protein
MAYRITAASQSGPFILLSLRVTNSDVALFGCFDTNAILCHATLVCWKYFMMKLII